MLLAAEEARKGAGFVAPNPLVGCTMLDRDGRLISSGYHKQYGQAHAEIEALKGLQEDQLEGAHVYVTLEPCAHHGKTPPCAEKLASLPIASVTYGIVDPNPLVSGKGLEILKNSGKEVRTLPELREDLEELAEIFLFNIQKKLPFVAMKVASSLDGQMALTSGESKWITNEASRFHTHHLRGEYSAILVGKRTIEIDNPSLNVRHPEFPGKTNRIVIFDHLGDTLEQLPNLNVLKVHRPEDIFVVTGKNLKREPQNPAGVNILRADFKSEGVFEIQPILAELYKNGITSILVEGGAHVYQAFLNQNCLQRMYIFLAPIVIGSQGALSWTHGFGVSSMKDRIQLRRVKTSKFEDDLLVTGLF